MTGRPGAAFRRGGTAPTLRVAIGGAQLLLDAGAVGLLGEGVTHVRLLYDRDTRRIGLMPTGAADPDGFPVDDVVGARSVRARAFVERYRIPIGVAFPLEREGDAVVARIPDGVPDGYVDEDAPRIGPQAPTGGVTGRASTGLE